jgi:hypothetical protein
MDKQKRPGYGRAVPARELVHRPRCPACGHSARTLHRSRFDQPPISTFLEEHYGRSLSLPEGEYQADECTTCGTIYQANVGGLGLLSEIYEEWITETPADTFNVEHPRLSRDGHEIIAAARFLRRALPEMVTLDYGMGWAEWAQISRSLGCRSYGFDLAPSRMASARSLGIETDLAGVMFDFINAEQVFEHVTDPSGLAADLMGRLKPGGILKISVPSNHGLKAALARLNDGEKAITRDEIMPLQPLEHVNCFTSTGLRLLTGLEPVKPSLAARYAFLPGVSMRHPRMAAKELVRPLVRWRSRTNLYLWFQKNAHEEVPREARR